MKKAYYFCLSLLMMMSCTVRENPVFLKVDNLKVVSIAADTVRLKAEAFFENPNDVGGLISTDEIKIIINGTEVAQVFAEEFKVPARKEFAIPLTAVIPVKKIFSNTKNGILGGLLNSLLNKSVKLQLKGDLKYKVFGFSKTYAVDQIQEIKL